VNDKTFNDAREARRAEPPVEQPQTASEEKRNIRITQDETGQGRNYEVKSSMGKPPERKADDNL